MVRKLFQRTKTDVPDPADWLFVEARLNARLQPFERGDFFEDPLTGFLEANALGEVVGGGTVSAPEPEGVESCDVAMRIVDLSPTTINGIVRKLEELGAPKGSVLRGKDLPEEIQFGVTEGLALFLNGTDLPDDVYTNNDINVVGERLESALANIGELRGVWQGSLGTTFYFYGESFAAMKGAIAEVVDTEPLCQQAQVSQIA